MRSLRFHFRHPTVLPLRAGPADDKSNEKLRRASPESYHPVARVDDTLATLRIGTAGMRPCSSVTLYAAAPGREMAVFMAVLLLHVVAWAVAWAASFAER